MNDNTVTLQPVSESEIPAGGTRRKYGALLQEFLDSGEKAVRLNLWDGANAATVSTGLRTAADKSENKGQVLVTIRKGHVYLIRT